MTDVAALPDDSAPPPPPSSEGEPGASGIDLGWAVAGLSAAAGAIHLAMVPSHAGGELIDPIGFAVVGWFQIMCAAVIISGRAGRNLYRAVVLGNLVVLGLWIWSRTTGLPVGAHSGVAEDVTIVDGTAAVRDRGPDRRRLLRRRPFRHSPLPA